MSNGGSSSAVVTRHDYLPFGEEIASGIGSRSLSQAYNASDTNRFKYGMTERDATSGLDHTWWRKYENTSGRWTSPDPLSGGIADPQSFNAYSYAGNDPVNFVDPNGLCGYVIMWVNNPNGTRTITNITSSPCLVNVYGGQTNVNSGGGGGGIGLNGDPLFQENAGNEGLTDYHLLPLRQPSRTPTIQLPPVGPAPRPAANKQTRKDCVNDAIRRFLGKEAVTAIKREVAQVLAFTLTMTTIFLGSHIAAAGAALEAGEITALAAATEAGHAFGTASLHAGGAAALSAYWGWTFKESYDNNKEFRAAVDACPKS